MIDKRHKIAEKEGIERHRYTRESKQLLRDTYNGTHPEPSKASEQDIQINAFLAASA